MRKRARRTKGGRRKSTLTKRTAKGRFVASRSASKRSVPRAVAAPAPRTRTITKVRYYSRPARRVRAVKRRAVRTRRTSSRIGSVIGAAVAGAAIGAMMGSIANEAGLLNSVPAQNKIGVSATGIVGVGLIVIGFFVKSEGMKLLFYGLGGGLVVEEITRQIDMRFYDFRVAFGNAPALDYAQGISGAHVQLAQMSAPAREPAQLPPGANAGSPQGAAAAPAPRPSSAPPARGADTFASRREDRRNDRGAETAPRGIGNNPLPAPRDGGFRNDQNPRDDQDFPAVATRGMDYDPSAMYRYALRVA